MCGSFGTRPYNSSIDHVNYYCMKWFTAITGLPNIFPEAVSCSVVPLVHNVCEVACLQDRLLLTRVGLQLVAVHIHCTISIYHKYQPNEQHFKGWQGDQLFSVAVRPMQQLIPYFGQRTFESRVIISD